MECKEKELLQEHMGSVKDAIGFFSGHNKPNREIWIVNEFLTNLGLKFKADELKLNKEDPPDVFFLGACFEIKEIQDKGRKRHDEYKIKLEKAAIAKTLKETMTMYTPKEISMQEIVNRINEELKNITYSPNFCAHIDLLFYVNLLHRSILKNKVFTIPSGKTWCQWRSVSMVMNNKACSILWTTDSAPDFLRSVAGTVIIKQD